MLVEGSVRGQGTNPRSTCREVDKVILRTALATCRRPVPDWGGTCVVEWKMLEKHHENRKERRLGIFRKTSGCKLATCSYDGGQNRGVSCAGEGRLHL